MDRRIKAVLSTIEKNYSDSTLNCKLLSRLVNLSPRRLEEILRAETRSTLTQHLRSKRMGVAKHLLANSFLSVKEIMYRVGYRSYSHFIHDFTREIGCSPGGYRRKTDE